MELLDTITNVAIIAACVMYVIGRVKALKDSKEYYGDDDG